MKATLVTGMLLQMLIATGANAQAPFPPMTVPAEAASLESAEEIDVGSFCLSNIARGVVVVGQSHLDPKRLWWNIKISVDKSATAKPTIYFFSKSRQPSTTPGPTRCSDSASFAIVKGKVTSADISALYSAPGATGPGQWYVNPKMLDAEFATADANINSIYGANVLAHDASSSTSTLTNRLLRVKNSSSALFFDEESRAQSGSLEITTTDVQLRGVRLALGPSTDPVNLQCRFRPTRQDKGRVTFRIDVSTGVADFVSGVCNLPNVQFKNGNWNWGGASIASRTSTAAVALEGGSPPRLTLSAVSIDSTDIEYGSGSLQITPTAMIKVDSITGNVLADKTAVSTDNVTLTGADIPSASIRIGPTKFSAIGTGNAHINLLSKEAIDAKFLLNEVQIPGLQGIAPVQLTSLVVTAKGKPETPTIAGDAVLTSIGMATLGLTAKSIPLHFVDTTVSTGGFTIPFNISLPAPLEGATTIGDASGQNVKLRGALKSLALKGSVTVAPDDVGLVIDPNGLNIAASVASSVSNLVLGSPVSFVDASFSLLSPDGLKLSSKAKLGAVDLSASGLILATPTLAFANPDQGYVLKAPLRTQGAASIRFDVASGDAKLQNAQILAETITGRALAIAPAVEIGGITLTSPILDLGKLSVKVVNGVGTVEGEKLHFTADTVKHPGNPYWFVTLNAGDGVTVPKFSATALDTNKSLNVTDALIEDLKISGASADFRSADGFAISGANFQVTAYKLSQNSVTNGAVSIANGDFSIASSKSASEVTAKSKFNEFNITMNSDAAGSINGTGAISFTDISVGGKTLVPIGECHSGEGWKLTGAFDLGQLNLGLAMTNGKVSGSATANSGKAYIVNDGDSSCGWDKEYTIVEEKWAEFNACPPFSCNVKTIIAPKMSGSIYWEAHLTKLDTSASVQQATFSVGGSGGGRVCLKQVLLNPPIIIASYIPTIKKGGFIGDFVHDLIGFIGASIESPLVTSFGTSVSFSTYLASLTGIKTCL